MLRRTRPLAAAGLSALAILVASACATIRIPSVPSPPEPFVRYPYLQAVTDSSAEVLWWTKEAVADTLVYWEVGSTDTVRVPRPDSTASERARLSPLAPDARIGYRLVTGPSGRVTPDHRFRTAPRRGTRSDLTALVFGDSGSGLPAQVELARILSERDADLILHAGDVAYPDGSDLDLTHRHFRVYREILARVPFYPTPGNHDVVTDGGEPFRRAFVRPGDPPSGGGFYYSFDWGRVHFVGLDTTGEDGDSDSDLRSGGRQLRWLEDDLSRAAADSGSEWIVVFFHHPPYSSATGLSGHGSDREVRRLLAPLFDRYGVDVVLTGHDHHYERSEPIRSARAEPSGPGTIYVVTGGGGGRMDWRGVGRADFAAIARPAYHFVLLEVDGSRMVLRAVDRQGEEIDRYEVQPVPPTTEPSGSPRP